MPTVFESISEGFYTAFFEPDPERRKAAIEAWIQVVTPIIQSAVENDIRAYLEPILKDTWTPEGWKSRAEKFNRLYNKLPFIDTYRLYLDVKLRPHNPNEKDVIVGALSPEIRARTLEAAEKALPKVKPAQNPKVKATLSTGKVDDDNGTDDSGDDGRSPNDDRSDSMNPNNDAYWSSRGR